MNEYNLLKSIEECKAILADKTSSKYLKLGTRLRKRLLKRKLNKCKNGRL